MTSIGLLGLGSIGLRHARNLLSLGAEVRGYDPSPERQTLLVEAGGRVLSDRAEAFLADAVLIASPSQLHRRDLQDAITAKRHVFIEKPLAHTDDGLEALLDLAEARGLVVFCGLNLRFHPVVRAAAELLTSGILGKVLWSRIIGSAYLPSWRPHQDYRQGYTANPLTGGAIFDNIHEIDLAFHLLGPGRVAGAAAMRSGTLEIEAEDIASLVVQHANGALSAIHLDYATRPAQRGFEIAGSGGIIRGDLLTRTLTHLDVDGTVLKNDQYPGAFADDYVAEMSAFLSCVAGNAKPPCDGRQALEVLRLALTARRLSGLPSS